MIDARDRCLNVRKGVDCEFILTPVTIYHIVLELEHDNNEQCHKIECLLCLYSPYDGDD